MFLKDMFESFHRKEKVFFFARMEFKFSSSSSTRWNVNRMIQISFFISAWQTWKRSTHRSKPGQTPSSTRAYRLFGRHRSEEQLRFRHPPWQTIASSRWTTRTPAWTVSQTKTFSLCPQLAPSSRELLYSQSLWPRWRRSPQPQPPHRNQTFNNSSRRPCSHEACADQKKPKRKKLLQVPHLRQTHLRPHPLPHFKNLGGSWKTSIIFLYKVA